MNCEGKNSKAKELASGTIIYAIGSFGPKILSLLIVPLYTYYIAPADLGVYDLLITTISLLTPLITLQISDAAYVWMIGQKDSIDNCIAAVYKFLVCTSIVAIGLILFVNYFIQIPYCYYFIGLFITSRFVTTIQKLIRGLKKQKLYAASGAAYTVIFLLLNLLQIVVLKQGIVALFQSAIFANSVTFIALFLFEKRLRQIAWKNKSVALQKKMLKFSIPTVPNIINWWIINASDRYIINFFLGSAANGIYAISYKFPSLLQLVFNLFYMSWQDTTLSDKDEDTGAFYSKIFRLYYQLSFSLLLALIPVTKVFIYIVMSEAYHESAQYISFLYLGTVFQAFSSFLGVGYLKSGKTSQAATTSIYGALINAGINILFIKFIGLQAASISTFLGFFGMFIIRAWQTRPILHIKIEWPRFLAFFVVAVFIAIISIYTTMQTDVVLSIVGVVVFLFSNHGIIVKALRKIFKRISWI